MKAVFVFCLAILVLAGCQHATTAPKSGTEVSTDGSGRTTVVNYVSQEKYQRMTPDERDRMHAGVGGSATWEWGGAKLGRSSAPLTAKDVDQAAATAPAK